MNFRFGLTFVLLAMIGVGLFACAWARGSWTPLVWKEFLDQGPVDRRLPDFSYAGYAMGDRPIPSVTGPLFDATRFGAVPDDGLDDTAAIQAAIDAAGAAGGGVVLVPKGRYEIHSSVESPFLRIRMDRIVLRGQGSADDGTILHLKAPAPAGRVHRLGSVPAEKEARHGAIVAIMGDESKIPLSHYIDDMPRGGRLVRVSETGSLGPGQTVVVEFEDPLIDPEHPAPRKADLAAQLTAPFRFVQGQIDSFGAVSKRHAWIVDIESIIDTHTVRLSKPARFDQWRRYNPRIFAFGGVRQAGIEHLRLQSDWPGNYRHHKPFLDADGKVVRSAREQDYLWNGIWISDIVDGWVRDVVFKDLTQGIIVSRSAHLTIQDLEFHGHAAHAGITIAHSNDVLVQDVDYYARMVHPITLKAMAAGNVFTDARTHYEGRDDHDATDAVIDFHGQFPYENLFEDLQGFYVCPGGDLSVLPHAGVRNVFWNIQAPSCMSCYTGPADTEFARTYDFGSTSSGRVETMFEHLPQAFYIGIHRKDGLPLTVGGTASDRSTSWMTVERLGRPFLGIPSLYLSQKRHRSAATE